MKARYRKTGEIVTIVAYSGRVDRNEILDYVYYIDSNGKEHTEDGRGLNLYWDFETEIENPSINKTIVDWSSFRREAANAAMSGMMANADFWQSVWSENRVKGRCDYPSEIAHFAIACADELIKQLKQK